MEIILNKSIINTINNEINDNKDLISFLDSVIDEELYEKCLDYALKQGKITIYYARYLIGNQTEMQNLRKSISRQKTRFAVLFR